MFENHARRGARISEAFALTPASIDIESGVASIQTLKRRKRGIVLDIAEAGESLGGGGPETPFLHCMFPLRGAGIRRSIGDLTLKHSKAMALERHEARIDHAFGVTGHGRSISTKSATRVGRRVRSRT